MSITQTELEKQATKLLNSRGFRWDGRPKQKVVPAQLAFDARMIPNPFGGRSTRKR